ncbi:MAG: hypothetical protein K5705_09405, partial [Oscillospiraceae bacterium]|nr:hypothetical protein [Oscillospiraceae bacterium]
MKPLLMIGLIHMFRAGQTKALQIRKQHPINKKGIICSDPSHHSEREKESLHESLRTGKHRHDNKYDRKTKKCSGFYDND